MWKTRLQKWGLYKKNRRSLVEDILRRKAQREAAGKKSSFMIRGLPVDMSEVERSAKRMKISPHLLSNKAANDVAAIRQLKCWTPPPSPGLVVDTDVALLEVLSCIGVFIAGSLQDPNAAPNPFWREASYAYGADTVDWIVQGLRYQHVGHPVLSGLCWRKALRHLEPMLLHWDRSSFIQIIRCFKYLGRNCQVGFAKILREQLARLARLYFCDGDPQKYILVALLRLDLGSLLQTMNATQSFLYDRLEDIGGWFSNRIFGARIEGIYERLFNDPLLSVKDSFPRVQDVDERFGSCSAESGAGILRSETVLRS